MNVFVYLILVLVASYPKVNEIKLIKKFLDGKTTTNEKKISNQRKRYSVFICMY